LSITNTSPRRSHGQRRRFTKRRKTRPFATHARARCGGAAGRLANSSLGGMNNTLNGTCLTSPPGGEGGALFGKRAKRDVSF
jgi:hypothetical protein